MYFSIKRIIQNCKLKFLTVGFLWNQTDRLQNCMLFLSKTILRYNQRRMETKCSYWWHVPMCHANIKSQLWASNDKFFTYSVLCKRNGIEIDFDTDGPHLQFHCFFVKRDQFNLLFFVQMVKQIWVGRLG